MRHAAGATVLLLAWGVLAFGGVRPWAYIPLFIGCAVVGAASRPGRGVWLTHRRILLPLLLILVAGAVQLIPVPRALLTAISPTADYVLRQYDLQYSATTAGFHALSIAPRKTAMAIMAFGCLFTLFAGTIAAAEQGAALRISAYVLVLGTVVALVGIIQQPVFNGRIYGLWLPPTPGNPFGPFVNRNHFAGWMLLALPLALGVACGRMSRLFDAPARSRTPALLWLASPEANQALLGVVAAGIMTAAVLLTLSRSGIAALLVGLSVMAFVLAGRLKGRVRLAVVAATLLILLAAVSMESTDRVMDRFANADWPAFGGRAGAARDAWGVTFRFMPTGSGLNTYGMAMLFFQTYQPSVHYAQAHNDYLQLLAEGGVLVGLPMALSLIGLARGTADGLRRSRGDAEEWCIRLGAATGLLAIALQELVDFSLQMPGNAVLFVVVAALAVHCPARPRPLALRRAGYAEC